MPPSRNWKNSVDKFKDGLSRENIGFGDLWKETRNSP